MLMLAAQSAQLSGDRDGAHRAFYAMAEREDTRLLGLRGLFIEAQRNDDPLGAVAAAEEALKVSPSGGMGLACGARFSLRAGRLDRCASIVERNSASGAIDKAQYRRQRAVLADGARAGAGDQRSRRVARHAITEAVKLAPTLIPAATLAAKFLSEGQQTRKAMQIIETAWLAQPHPGSRRRLRACAARRFRAGAAAPDRAAGRASAGPCGRRARHRPRRGRCARICARARGDSRR